MKEENIKTVEAYLFALRDKNLSLAPLADHIDFEDSIAGKVKGAENVCAFLSGFLPAIKDIRIISHICENDYIATHWEADTSFGIIPILEKFRIADGKIVEAVGYFDPRPIFG